MQKKNVIRWTGLIATIFSIFLLPGCVPSSTTDNTLGYILTTSKEGQGTLNNSGGNYDLGEQLTLTATPADGWYFSNWSGDLPTSVDSTQKEITITINSNKELNAVFKANPQVLLETSKGNIKLELYMDKAPITVKNFLRYAKEGFFDGQDNKGATVFHRVIAGFMIQGGGMTSDLKQKVTFDPIENESTNGVKNEKYTIAMARTSDPNSATSQFFINVADNAFLNYQNESNPGYAAFGKVIEGTDVVDAIAAVATHTVGYYSDVPVTAVTITKVTVTE
jgi:peptidyl-prolyl cis-trans isomerase B (cyclophilin B)